jgi:predicted metal-dependent phosphoesterase TrpH
MDRIMRESYNTPEGLYRLAKARGMDLVTITDHDQISGVLTIADRNDVIIGCEITATFPEDKTKCHIGVLGINETQYHESQRLKDNAHELVRYLNEQEIFCSLNHLASLSAGRMKASHVFSLLPWLDAIETKNGTRPRSQNRTAAALATAHGKVTAAGSDSHTYRGIGKTYMVCDNAGNREEFMAELKQGRVRVEGCEGGYLTLASDIVRLTASFYVNGFVELIAEPLNWRKQLMVLCSTLGLPLTAIGLAAAYIYHLQDEKFNSDLLLDLVAVRDLVSLPLPIHSRTSPEPVHALEPALQD